MSHFATPAHLASWAKFSPTTKESAGRMKGRVSTGHGNRYLARALGEAAVQAGKSNTFLGERYRRLARRRGKRRSILTIIWHLLDEPGNVYVDFGPDHYQNRTAAAPLNFDGPLGG